MRFLLLMLLLTSCTSHKRPFQAPLAPLKPLQETPKAVTPAESGVIWESFHDSLSLQYRNIDSGESVTVNLEQGIKIHPLGDGPWELNGFLLFGRSFTAMNTPKRIVVTVKGKIQTYAGSYLIGCPRVKPQEMKLLKGMKFFDRFPFTSQAGLCELIVGNNLKAIKKERPGKMRLGF